MLSLGFISFATPWALAAAAALPLVWLLLRLTPPTVKQISFPAIRLLFGLDPTKRTAAHTPPWLLLLRIGILLLALLGLADPILNLRQSSDNGPLILVLDNGWASANAWEERLEAARGLLENADRRGQPAVLVTTAPVDAGTTPQPLQFAPARDVLARTLQATAQAWPSDRLGAVERLKGLKVTGTATATWISDGVDTPGVKELAAALSRFGNLTVIETDALTAPRAVPARAHLCGQWTHHRRRQQRHRREDRTPCHAAKPAGGPHSARHGFRRPGAGAHAGVDSARRRRRHGDHGCAVGTRQPHFTI